MMSQNRQDQKDRAINTYISKIILRSEYQARHINAKMDHLMTHQWKRLLEIQEIQIDLLEILERQQRSGLPPQLMRNVSDVQTGKKDAQPLFWNAEITPDEHALMLLRHSLNCPDENDEMIFAHWHKEGDNFVIIYQLLV
jgi:hypothetical protein